MRSSSFVIIARMPQHLVDLQNLLILLQVDIDREPNQQKRLHLQLHFDYLVEVTRKLSFVSNAKYTGGAVPVG